MGTRDGAGAFVVLCPLAPEAMAARIGLARFGRHHPGRTPRGKVQMSGMGPNRARQAASRLAREVPAGLPVVVVGVGGSLVRGLEAGDLVVASAFSVAQTTGGSGLEVTASPILLDETSRELAEHLASALSARFASTRFAPLVSAERTVRGEERDQLARSGAVICDTESAWLARLADRAPFAVVRSVVDTPEQELLSLGTLSGGLRALRRLVGVSEVIAEVLS